MSVMIGVGIMTVLLAVTPAWVQGWLERLVPPSTAPAWAKTYPETAVAIADAANGAPIFKGADGARRTAGLLIAIAFYESSFNPVAIGDGGSSFGLFQIQLGTAREMVSREITLNTLMLPRDAAPIAVAILKRSFAVCAREPWEDRLSWYAAGGPSCSERGKKKSETRMMLAERIVKEEP